MGEDWREIAGYLEALKVLEPELAKDEDFKQVEMMVQRLGESTFKMDIVSHLAMKAKKNEALANAK